MASWLDPEDIERLANDPVRRMRMPAVDRIDFSKPFLPEEYTQLYYTPIYRSLHRQHRLRYNQLFGVRRGDRERLLAKHVLVVGEKVPRDLVVQVGRRTDDDRVDEVEQLRVPVVLEPPHPLLLADTPGTAEGLATVVVLPWNERYTREHVEHIGKAIRSAASELAMSAP
jgi:hypothetical protein